MTDLTTVASRERLKAQREPYWQRLAVGQFLGFRPLSTGKGGNWIARYYDSGARKQRFHALGDFGSLPQNERFSAASAAARKWFTHLSAGGSHEVTTVEEACRRYAATRPDAEKRFERYVYGDPIAKIKLQKLKDHHVIEWRQRLSAMPALVSRSKSGEQRTRQRNAATVNRDMVPFRAALNLAVARGEVLTAKAWKAALEPAKATGRRDLYLDREQRRSLLRHATPSAASFLKALCLMPVRPGALADLRVADFDARNNVLTIDRDKAGEGRRIPLSHDAGLLLKENCRLKLPAAPLFTRADGTRWTKDSWKVPIKDAVVAAELPPAATAYTLRHSVITDLVVLGLPLLTVAQLAGTSVRMIEKHYGHLQQKQAIEALSSLTL